MNQLAANLVDRVLPVVPIRHWVMSFPMKVRFLLAWRPTLRNEVMAAFFDIVLGWYRSRVSSQGHPRGRGGAVGVWHLAGSSMNCNPHIHAIVLDGVYALGEDEQQPVFRPAQRPTRRIMEHLARQIRARVEGILERHGLLEHADLDEEDGQLAMQLASVQGRDAERVRSTPLVPPRERAGLWGWDEFYDLHAGQPIHAADRNALERLARYVARPPLSLKRLSELPDGRLCLSLKSTWDDGTSCFVFTAQQLLARLASVVPQPRHNLTHYFGVLAPHAGWRALIVPDPESSKHTNTTAPTRRTSWIPWAELMMRTWGTDPLRCLQCGGPMLLRAIVRTRETAYKLLVEVLHHPFRIELLQPARAAPAKTWW